MTERRDVRVSRRDVLKLSIGGGAGLALGGLLDWPAAAAAARGLKLSDVQEFTTSCNFCSCGCGMIASVRDGTLIAMEGDFDHVVNGGSLCVKGISMFATHASPKRLGTQRYRAPGSDHWEEISWQAAAEKIARKIHTTPIGSRRSRSTGGGLRIGFCEACRGYLKTYEGQGEEQLLLADWTSLHLDLLAHRRGLKRQARSLYDLDSLLGG